MQKIDLTGEWQFRLINDSRQDIKDKSKLTRWMKASVPGTVHTDLMTHGIIPDPYYRMNENEVQWVAACSWEYRKSFSCAPDFLEYQGLNLVAEGLDTFCTISLNGQVVAETNNMFIEQRIDIKKYLKKGKNLLSIVFHSPTQRADNLEKEYGRLLVANAPRRVHVRKAQYSFGWDWGPKLTTSGIWKSIYLEGRDRPFLRNPFVKTISLNPEFAILDCFSFIEGGDTESLKMNIAIFGDDRIIESSVPLDNDHASTRVEVPEPRLWWPNGSGEPYLYRAVFQLLDHNDNLIDSAELTFGIRTVKLLREKDEQGESFIIEINGEKIFSKGANWIPADNFIPRINDETYTTLLELAASANMNMIRVWGGGIYEQKIFYDLCDRLGIMIWQDFMFACGEYPEHSSFQDNVRREATYIVQHLRNHPSIVLWCGNNECEYLFCNQNPDKSSDDMKGTVLFRDLLRDVCNKYDDSRPYWRSSPFGTGHPNAESNGNHHQWEIWSNWGDYKKYSKVNARFITEFGFQAPPHRKTLDEVTIKSDRHFQSPVLEHHNKQIEGTERLYRFQAAHYIIKNEYDEFIYRGQLVQAEALKHAVEYWRSRKFQTAGSIFWQLNDCWQVSSWSVIDSALRPKAAYYYASRFFAPVLVSIHHSSGEFTINITNDNLNEVSGNLKIDLLDMHGKIIPLLQTNETVGGNISRSVATFDQSALPVIDPATQYIRARYLIDSDYVTLNRYFFVEPKYLNLPKPKLKTKITKEDDRLYRMDLASTTFVKNVQLDLDNGQTVFSDNFFDLDPGETGIIYFRSNKSLQTVKKQLSVRWLGS